MTSKKGRFGRIFDAAKRQYKDLGGWAGFTSGEWVWRLMQKSFRNYWERANAEYFSKKYATSDPDKLAAKLIAVAAKNSALLGGATAAAVSTDEIVALLTGGELLVGLPANASIAAAAMGAEAILLLRIQLQLVANLGKAYGVPLDPDDPEDILTILAFALGGSVADAAGKAGAKIGGRIGGRVAKTVISKDVLASLRRLAAKIGVKLLQRTIVKYVVPFVSIGIGTGWNYVATRSVGRMAIKHFKQRLAES
jgi:uncharacterized protein (DUF697 family)